MTDITTLAQRHRLADEEADELARLLAAMRPLNFATSKQLSNHITSHRLGHEYPTIAGIVEMAEDDEMWDFDGGFPPRIYRIICSELGLSNQGTRARPVGFRSYAEIENS